MNCSMPGFSIYHYLPRFDQTMLIESLMPSDQLILCCPLLLLPPIFPASGPFPMSQFFASGGQSIGAWASQSVIPINIQEWFPLRLTDLISLKSKGLSRVFFGTIIQKHQFCGTQPSYGAALTSVHDYWKSHSLEYMDLCQQSDGFTF